MSNVVLRQRNRERTLTWRCTAAIRRSSMHRHSCSIRTVRGELASNDSWQRGRRTEAFFLVFLNPSSLPRNNRLACHSTTLASDEVAHVTPDIPLVARSWPILLPRRGPTLSSLARFANKPQGTHTRRSQLGYPVLTSAMEAPPSVVRPCIRPQETPFTPFGEEKWRCTARNAVWLG